MQGGIPLVVHLLLMYEVLYYRGGNYIPSRDLLYNEPDKYAICNLCTTHILSVLRSYLYFSDTHTSRDASFSALLFYVFACPLSHPLFLTVPIFFATFVSSLDVWLKHPSQSLL